MFGAAGLLLPAVVIAFLPLVSRDSGLRVTFLRAVLLTTVILAFGTELLSIVHGLRPSVVFVYWLLVLAVTVVLGLRYDDGERRWVSYRRRVVGRLQEVVRVAIRTPSLFVMVAIVLVVLSITLVIAVAAPPNNWDSMTYHLPRVMHWASNHSLHDYPTTIDRQLDLSPFAEYMLLHIYLLTGSDLMFNSLQWSALLGSAIVVSVIARQLGGDRRAQALAAVIAVCTPMAILQASTTQNDVVEAFFLLLTVRAVLAWEPDVDHRWIDAWEIGGALALSLLTKDTGYIFAGPFLVLWLVRSRRLPRQVIAATGLIVVLVGLVNVSFFVRNDGYFGSPLGSAATQASVSNSRFTPAVTATQTMRILAAGSAWKSLSMNARVGSWVNSGTVDVGVSPTDPGLLYGAGAFSLPFVVQEDYAGFPAQEAAIALVLLATILFVPQLRGLKAAYVASCSVGFLLFASYLRWQPWITRLDMPLVLVWSPVVAVAIVAWYRFLAVPAALGFAFFTPAYLQHNTMRSLVGPASVFKVPRIQQMFYSHGDLYVPYLAATKMVNDSKAKRIGLVQNADDWEYPLWRMTGGALNGRKYFDVTPSDLKGKPVPAYDMAICTDLRPNACAVLAKPGWTLTPVGAGVQVATRTS